MKTLLIFVDWFVPGFKGGGQIQSCLNLATALQQEIKIMIVTTDRDLGSNEQYTTIVPDKWTQFDHNIQVLYLSPSRLGYKSIKSVIREVRPDVIYLNSMFSVYMSLLPIEVCRFDNWKVPVILAPRGMLHKGALQYKTLKKKLFLHSFKVRGFHRRITFHATDHREEADIRRAFGIKAKIFFVGDFPASKQDQLTFIEKKPSQLRCLFVGRMTATKNLLFLINLLSKAKESIHLTVIGPPEDPLYWEECAKQIALLPANIVVDCRGPLPNSQLPEIYRSHHLFILPTQGENFGHVIFESLVNGRPVLISALTPWKELQEKQVGWDIPLEDEAAFATALKEACEWNQDQFNSYCVASWELASKYADTSALRKQYLQLFQ